MRCLPFPFARIIAHPAAEAKGENAPPVGKGEMILPSIHEVTVHNWDELQSAIFDGVWDEKTYRWTNDAIGWWIAQVGATWYPKNEWYMVEDKWYYFDDRGYMVTGTRTIDDKIYSFNKNGELVS